MKTYRKNRQLQYMVCRILLPLWWLWFCTICRKKCINCCLCVHCLYKSTCGCMDTIKHLRQLIMVILRYTIGNVTSSLNIAFHGLAISFKLLETGGRKCNLHG